MNLEIGDGDELPLELIDYLEQLPASTTRHDAHAQGDSSEDAPPAKRPKTSHQGDYVIVSRQTLSLTRPCVAIRAEGHRPLTRRNIGERVTIKLSAENSLTILSRQKFRRRALRVSFSLDQDQLSEALVLSLEVFKKNPTDTSTPGAFWTTVDIRLEYQDKLAVLHLDFEVRWTVSTFVSQLVHSDSQCGLRSRILRNFFPDVYWRVAAEQGEALESRSPQDFYEAAFFSDPDSSPETADLQVPHLTSELYPFQRRAVQWLLGREGVRWTSNAVGDAPGVVPLSPTIETMPAHFIKTWDTDGTPCFISDLLGVVTKDFLPFTEQEAGHKGGILAEEMGLGKTLEIISLILLHRRPEQPPVIYDSYLGAQIRRTGATLIVTPPSLKHQWAAELDRHAPQLRVMVYPGIGKRVQDPASELALVEELAAQDVVITTYHELKTELHFALDPPTRAIRSERKHHRPKSPLVQLSWWRVCLDEAQEVESGVSNTATFARIIPRVNAWGVTGTPVKDGVQDLWGLLSFLRYEPYASVPRVWQHLTRSHKDVFQALFNRISLRHTKRLVRDELALPPQKRYVMTIPFTAVEEQYYQEYFQTQAARCGLSPDGEPLRADWNPDDPAVLEAMKTALNRLRQAALHPQVVRPFGQKNDAMRTVAEVLDAMMEQSNNAITVDQRAILSSKLTRGQLLENSPRVKEALAIWKDVLESSDVLVQDSRQRLQVEIEQAKETDADARQQGAGDGGEDADNTVAPRVGDAQRKLRYALELQHKAVFFCANAHFQIKSNGDMTPPGSEEFERLERLETEGYDRAKAIRSEILRDSHSRTGLLMARIAKTATEDKFAAIPEVWCDEERGSESRAILDGLEDLAEALNKQADLLDEMRQETTKLLLKDLVDEDDGMEITGDEYTDSTKVQEDVIAFVTVLRAVVADRLAALSGQKLSKLTVDEIENAIGQAEQGDGPSPALLLALFERRDKHRPELPRSLRSIVTDLRDLSTRLRHRAHLGSIRAQAELDVVVAQLRHVQDQVTQQTKVAQGLEQEIDRFTGTMNARVEYYRQLQTLSDQVAPYEGPSDDAAMAQLLRDEETLMRKLATSEAKHRYLLHLKETDTKEDQRPCIICHSPYTVGVLTVCGHAFCKGCIDLWHRAHRNCPVCKRRLRAEHLHDFTLKPRGLKIQYENGGNGGPSASQQSPGAKRKSIFTEFSAEKLAEIKNIEIPGRSFTTKVDSLVRHVQWLRNSDPAAKSIVFSQYPDFLKVVGEAFRRHRVGFSAFTESGGIESFKHDPSVECFLLHAKAHSSGLNLVNASHVILCEPILNTAIELQAIARVDRIGQEHETTVWLYIVDGTVEESIYDLSVRRRMEHMGRNFKGKSKESTPELLDITLEDSNALEMQGAQLTKLMRKGKGGGEAVPKDDLYPCLFGSKAMLAGGPQGERLRNDPRLRRYLPPDAADRG